VSKVIEEYIGQVCTKDRINDSIKQDELQTQLIAHVFGVSTIDLFV
jgi:hypothetical protein